MNFQARFPPSKKVQDLIEFPAFDLEADSVTMKIMPWDMEVAALSDLTKVWLTVKGIPPQWCAWKLFAQVASIVGILMDIDRPVLFKSLYALVRMKVAVRDVSKVPSGRIVEMAQRLYMLTFMLESVVDVSFDWNDNPPGPSTVVPTSSIVLPMETEVAPNASNGQEPATVVEANSTGGHNMEESPLLIDVTDINLTDHMSWNGKDHANEDMDDDDLVSVDSLFSISDRWDYSKVDDNVCDFDPSYLNLDEILEKDAVKILEQSAASIAYCFGILQPMQDEDSDSEKEPLDDFGDYLTPEVCEQIATTKKNLLPLLNQASSGHK
jgi:hypothetical protein